MWKLHLVLCFFTRNFRLNCIMASSELFSLEEDECNELFITQTPKDNLINHMELSQNEEVGEIFGVKGTDFKAHMHSVVDKV